MNSKKEILCLHYYFPPLLSTAVIRNYYITCALTDFFENVHVITSDNHTRFPSEKRSFPANLHLQSTYTLDYRRLLAGKNKKDSHNATTKKANPIFQWLLKVQKSFPFNLFLAEGNLIYIYGAYQKAKKLIDQGRITTIYSSFGPYADHFVAYLLKRKYPHLRWIADYRDLQIEPIYKNVVLPSYQRRIEKKILSKADLVTSISDGLSKQLELNNRPTITVLRGVELRTLVAQYDKFTISYTGSLYFDYRDPRALFSELKSMIDAGDIESKDLQILYAGRDGLRFSEWILDAGLSSVFINKEMVAQEEAKTIQNKSHINLLLTSSSPELTGVLTGKVFEYFEALNPTLCLINGVYDPEFEALFSELQAGTVVYNPPISKGKMRSFILDKYQEWKSTHQVKSTLNQETIKSKYGWKSQVGKMIY
ncbi:MAG: hypothetical protein ACI9P5_002681 [Saprospiraceae bacterium]|jgi:hypothetical protein